MLIDFKGATALYASRGWPVFPVHGVVAGRCTCGRRDCEHPGKHPLTPHGFRDATTDAMVLAGWNGRWPAANVGIATGPGSGLLVMDVDPRHGGDESLRDLEQRSGRLPPTPNVVTGGGGEHRYLRHPGGHVPSRNGVAPGVDIKADGGYVIAPPSLHLSGRRYEWEAGLGLDDLPLAEPPFWLLLLARPEHRSAGPSGDIGIIPEGQRNGYLASLAGAMRRRGMTEAEIAAALTVVNTARCKPPLDDREVQRIAMSVGRYSAAPIRTALERRAYSLAQRLR